MRKFSPRKGKGQGKGSGWKNLNPEDPIRHGLSARGIKTAQLSPRVKAMIQKNPKLRNLSFEQLKKKGVFLRYQADSDKDGVPNIKDCRPLNKKKQEDVTTPYGQALFISKERLKEGMPIAEIREDLLETKGLSEGDIDMILSELEGKEPTEKKDFKETAKRFAGRAGAFALKTGKKGVELAGKGLAELRERRQERAKQVLEEIDHPTLKKLGRQQDRVAELEKQIAQTDDEAKEARLFDELGEEQQQLRELQEDVTEFSLQDVSDPQLRVLAVNWKDTSFFGLGGNPYEEELLRRIRKRAELDRAVADEKKRQADIAKGGGGLFDFA